ncbi:hypothetical protein [Cribrihabitans neustonicus]|uniref:hypothetical protein n=1 Tax=Cribrihabitans neustonicus TaxID=1429085 RepID=UPI003B5BB03A
MKPADHSEPQQDAAHSLTASRAGSVQQPGTDILTPLASRSLFWRARYLEASPALCHIPLLFWLTETVRPRIAVTLGAADAVPHFALCQAVDKLGLDSLCIGVDDRPLNPDAAQFNQRNYADFSQFCRASEEAPEDCLPAGSKADMVIVARPASKAMITALSTAWLPRMAEEGILLFLQEPEAEAAKAFHTAFAADEQTFTLWQHGGVSLVLRGGDHSERLQRLVRLKPGRPGFVAASTVFRRLGELHSKSIELEQADAGLTQARQSAALSAAELQKAQAELKTRAGQEEALPKLRRELAHARQQNSLLQEELERIRTRLPTLEEEVPSLRKLLSEQEEALAERYSDIAALGLEIQENTKEIAALRAERDASRQEAAALKEQLKELAALKEQLTAAQEQRDAFAERVRALEHSTSWKVTAPLRKAVLTLKRA